MNLLVLGPPASGKGTQAKLIVEKLGVLYFEAGDVLRELAKGKTSLGQKIAQAMKEGKLVPDKTMSRVVSRWLDKKNLQKG